MSDDSQAIVATNPEKPLDAIQTDKTPAKRGRPTTYKPEYAERLKGMGERGLSMTQMAVELGVPSSTFQQWISPGDSRNVVEFEDAFAREAEKAQAYYENMAHGALANESKGFQGNLWKYIMMNRYHKSYKPETQLQHGNAVNIQVNLGGSSESELL